MADVDPEKILAELEAARLAASSRRAKPGRNAVLVVIVLLILAIASIALWVLTLMLDGLPRPERSEGKGSPSAAAPAVGKAP